MKRFILLCSVLFIIFPSLSRSQVSKDAAVLLEARIDSSTGTKVLALRWSKFDSVIGNFYSRRLVGAASWGSTKVIPLTSTEYIDNTIVVGKSYEYRIQQSHKVGKDTIYATGYLQGGIEVPPVHDRGGIFVLVDSTYSADLAPELTRLGEDLRAEGWIVQRIDVPRTNTSVEVKDKLRVFYDANPTFWKALFVVGHVPVPYSGFLNPDGHPDHFGAWPTDLYYAEFDGDWTDDVDESQVTNPSTGKLTDTNTIRVANRNHDGDGKFDQTQLPDNVDLMAGRVDFNNMPAFTKSEKELLKQYLDKDHNFRVGILTAPARGLVDVNFGYMDGEAFGSSGWRNISPLVGIDSVKDIDWFTTLSTQPYLWAYGCGGGWDQGAGGIGSTNEFVNQGSKAIFTMLFGSYFGDWNTQNNFLRAPLASEYGLSCAWSGRPYWHFFPMGLGETIGYCAKLSQNNSSEANGYVFNNIYRIVHWVHMEFLGDPTLRMHPIAPPTALQIVTTPEKDRATLTWTASPDKNILGYYVYRAHTKNGPYTLITSQPRVNPSHTDIDPLRDSNYYFVHAVQLTTTPSGSYYNLSPGIQGVSYGLTSGVLSAATNNENDLRIIQTALSTQIIFTPSSSAQYTIEVVDATGRTIKTLHNGVLSPGSYRFDWDNTLTSSGLYFIRATGGRVPETAKVLIVK